IVKDQDEVGMPGVSVTLAGDGNPATVITAINAITDEDGVATFEVSRTVAGVVTFSAPASGTPSTPTAAVTFTQPAPSAVLSFLAASPHGVEADGTDSSLITVRVVDSFGVPIQGISNITLSQGGGHSVISSLSGPTNAD